MAEVRYGGLLFPEAIAFFRGKVNVPTHKWDDLMGEAHDVSFVVAGVTKAELLADLRKAVDAAISEGISLGEFRKRFKKIIADHGWEPYGGADWRSEVIYTTNMRTAYAAGRYRQLTEPEFRKRNPFWRYRHGLSRTPREMHLAWNGLVLDSKDPWWKTHYPPNGWGCRCYVEALSAGRLKRLGIEPDKAPPDDMIEITDRNGRTWRVPKGVDPGWDYTPGAKNLAQHAKEVAALQADTLPAKISQQMMQAVAPEAATRPLVATLAEAKELGQRIVGEVLAEMKPDSAGRLTMAGMVGNEDAAAAVQLRDALLNRMRQEVVTGRKIKVSTPACTARTAVEEASRRYPSAWVEAADRLGALRVSDAAKGGSWHFTAREDGDYNLGTALARLRKGDGVISTSRQAAAHELAHRLQFALPALQALWQAEHELRTAGEPLERLVDLAPGVRNTDIKVRKDKYIEMYMGREYDSYGAMEVMASAYGYLLMPDPDNDDRLADMAKNDRELIHLAVGLLAGWRP